MNKTQMTISSFSFTPNSEIETISLHLRRTSLSSADFSPLSPSPSISLRLSRFQGESLRYSSVEINSLVALWSIWKFLGRFGAGYASDALLHKKGWPRPLLMAATLGTMTIGHLVIASGFQGNLYVGSVIVGVCYGSQWYNHV